MKGRSRRKRVSGADRSAEIPDDEGKKGFPIVAIGASAGGFEAFREFLGHLPVDTGMGFVLVQHLDPAHESELARLLARSTPMLVREVTNDLQVEANHVYVIPPNASMGIANGVLKLQARPQTRTPHRSIDFFFESLAQDQHERAIGVILSGTATDGTLGLEAIKAEGGFTFAQDESASYDSMPRSAIAAGCVDLVLSPEKIATELARIAKHPEVKQQRGTEEPAGETPPGATGTVALPKGEKGKRLPEDEYKKILMLLRQHSGVDFSLYKTPTIQRRITRRIVLNQLETLEAYARFLRGNARELNALYADALINVSSFFRNAETFETLKQKVFPRLMQEEPELPLRVWVVGCSTGQEAYSIAMAFTEFSEQASKRQLQIFATDVNEAVLDKARHGLYPKTAVQDVSPERLRRFFTQEDGGYRVSKALREMCVFARQNLLSDPPFSRMDLISCRNVMIYVQDSMQRKVVPTFHYALKPHGFLFLGASESIGPYTELFEPLDKKQKLYARKPGPTPPLHVRFAAGHPAEKISAPAGKRPERAPQGIPEGLDGQREADRLVLHEYGPPGVLINADFQVLQFRGDTSRFLKQPSGRANFHLLKMAREGLLMPLRAAINRAKKEGKPIRKEKVRVDQDGHTRTVDLMVMPLKNLKDVCYLVLFEEADEVRQKETKGTKQTRRRDAGGSDQDGRAPRKEPRRVAELERELAETRDYLQVIQDQHEATNEELQASNEEATSANEELQSVNEELETSKEELESANEELTTVNEEMGNRNTELTRLTGDLNNLHVSINTAILVVSRDLLIRRFTPLAEKVFNLLATDVGRPLSGARHNLELPELEELVREVIDTVSLREREARDNTGRWYSLRIRPYMTVDNKVDGAVLLVVDIDRLKRSEQEIKAARDYAEATLRTARDPLVVLRGDLTVESANDAFYKLFRTTRGETEGRPLLELGNRQWKIPALRQLLENILPRNSFFNDFEVVADFPNIGHRTMLLNARRLDSQAGVPQRVLLAIEDVTDRLESQAALRASELRYRGLFEAAHDGVLIIDPVNRKITDANPFMLKLLGYSREEMLGKELYEIGLLKDERAAQAAFRELEEKHVLRYEDLPLETKGGEQREVEVVANLYTENGHEVIQCNIRDVTERKRAEKAERESHAALEAHAEELARFNSAAVGRELRMIELKKEINELCQRHGEAARYPLEFEGEGRLEAKTKD